MKTLNLLTLVLVLLSFKSITGQTFKLLDQKTNAYITGLNIYERTTSPLSSESNLYDITNLSSSTQTFVITKYILARNIPGPGDSANIYFCTGLNCFTPPQMSATFTLPASGTMTLRFDMDEASIIGKSKVRYLLQNKITTGDSLVLVFDYNKTLGLSEKQTQQNLFSLFPNPCNDYFEISTYSAGESECTLKVVNALGQEAYSSKTQLNAGRNTLRVQTATLPRGIYSLHLSGSQNHYSKQFVVE